MKIVHVYGAALKDSHVKRLGGIEEHFLSLSQRLKDDLYIVYAGEPKDEEFLNKINANSSSIIMLGDDKYSSYLLEFIKLIKKVKKEDNDLIVHVHFGPISHMIIFICRLLGINNVYWTKHSRLVINKYSKSWFINKISTTLIDKAICVSLSVEDEMQELNLAVGKTFVVPLGINIEKYQNNISQNKIDCLREELNIDDKVFVITIVAQQRPEKRVEVFVKAFAEFLKINKESNSIALIVGGGPLEEENKKLAKSLGILEQIKFLGLRHDINVIYALSDLAGLTSETEGFGLAIAEAACMSVPLFGSNAGAMPELIIDGESGFLFEVGDYKALSNIFNKFYHNQELCIKFGKKALEDMVRKYDINLCSNRLIQLYKNEFGD